jgi:hypothetical protein
MDTQTESADALRRQKGTEEPRRWTATISEKMRHEETTTGKHSKCYQDLQEDFRLQNTNRTAGSSVSL